MKTLYTLLLAFGLCLTSHAQSMQNYDTYYNQASVTEKSNMNDIFKGTPHKLILAENQQTNYLWNDGSALKMIDIFDLSAFNQQFVNSHSIDFSQVKAIKFNNINSQTQITSVDLSNYTQLEYVIFDIDNLNVVSHANLLMQTLILPSNIKVLYRYLMET